jgi:tetratricopeptide (TPR) repeat protein
MLALAAVVGSTVDPETLRQLCDWTEEAFLEASNELLRRQLLLETGELFSFAHEQIRQALYRGIDPKRRRDLHRQVGQMLEQHAPDRAEELAFHFYRGQWPNRALPYCMQAGEHAYSVYATSAALTYFGQAISAARRLRRTAARPLLLRAHERRGQMLEQHGEYEQAASEYAAMLALAREEGDTATVARAIRYSGWLHGYRQEKWDEGLREARRAYEVAVTAGSALEKAAALRDMGTYESMMGNYRASLEAHHNALAFVREAGDPAEEANILQYIAIGHLFLSHNDQALEVFQQALRIREQLGDLRIASRVRANIGLLQINRGEFASAERFLRQAEAGFREVGMLTALPLAWIGLATVLRYRGECAASLAILETATELQSTVGSSAYMDSLIHLHSGAALWDMGQLNDGLAQVRTSVALARQSNTPTLVVGCLRVLGLLSHILGANERAAQYHQEAIDLADQAAYTRGQAENLTGLGLAELACGQLSAARRHLVEAMRQARRHGPQMRAEAAAALAELCLAEWQLRPAQALASWALARAEQMDLRQLQVRALFLRARAWSCAERLSLAQVDMEQALKRANPPGYPMLRWGIMLHLGQVLALHGRPDDAQCFYEQAQRAVEAILSELEDEDLRSAFAKLPGVWALRGGTAPPRAGQVLVALARLGIPSGRPLRPDERVTVRWTVDTGDTDAACRAKGGKKLLRQQRILRLLSEARAQGGDPSEGDLAQALGVSVRTVRSDVATLRAAGQQVRTRGTRG